MLPRAPAAGTTEGGSGMRFGMRWAIGLVGLIIVVAAVGAVMLALRLRTPRQVDIPTWAHSACTAEETYVQAIEATADNVDPNTLDLATRKQRADRIGKAEIAAADQVAKTLKGVTPPDAARPFHDALIHDANEEAAATREQLDAIARATTAQQIAMANSQVRFRRDASSQNLDAAYQKLGPDVLNALAAEPACQSAPLAPVSPGAPPAQPTPAGSGGPSSRGPA